MATQEQIATALISVELPSSSVAGLCLEMAKITNPVVMPTPPDAISVEKVMGKGWAKVATAVVSGTKEFMGKRLAKHSSVQIRRLLAERSSDEETLRSLHVWGEKMDSHTFDITMLRLDPEWLVARIETGTTYKPSHLKMIGASIVERRPDLYDRVRSFEHGPRTVISETIAPQLAEGRISKWTLADVLAAESSSDRAQIAQSVCFGFTETVDTDLLDTLCSYPETHRFVESVGFPRASGFTPDAALTLIKIRPHLALQVIATNWDDSLYDAFIETGIMEVLQALLEGPKIPSRPPDDVSRAILATRDVVSAGDSYRPVLLSRNLLSALSYELDTEVLLQYLRHTDEHATWAWLLGQFAQKPRPGEVEALVKNPGFAFGWESNYSTSSPNLRFQSASIESIAIDTTNKISSLVEHEWCDELVDALGSTIFDRLINSYHTNGAHYVARRFAKELGDDRDLWRDALAYFPKSTLSIGKSLKTIRRLGSVRKTSDIDT